MGALRSSGLRKNISIRRSGQCSSLLVRVVLGCRAGEVYCGHAKRNLHPIKIDGVVRLLAPLNLTTPARLASTSASPFLLAHGRSVPWAGSIYLGSSRFTQPTFARRPFALMRLPGQLLSWFYRRPYVGVPFSPGEIL